MYRRLMAVVLGVVLSVVTVGAHAADIQGSKHILDNGLTVLIKEMPTNPMVSVYALVKTGSATEGKFLGTGISHYLEHMLFKGTHGRDVGEIAGQIQAMGGSINASTSYDHTIYTIDVPHAQFDKALEILNDMVFHATIDAKEVESERDVILGEMRMNEDNPDRVISWTTFQQAYITHPYRHPIIGYKSTLKQVTQNDLLEYYQAKYVPNNVILSVAGNVKERDILPKIKNTFSAYKRRPEIVRPTILEPKQIHQRHFTKEYPTDLSRLSLAYASVSLLDPDLYPLDVLAKILGQGESSRLYLDVYKDKGLVHDISAYNYTPVDQGLFIISSLLEYRNLEQATAAIMNQIDVIKAVGVKEDELEKCKRQVLKEHVSSQQTTSSVAHSMATDEAYAGDFNFSQSYLDGIRLVTNEDILRVANQYLNEKYLTMVALNPRQPESEEETAEFSTQGQIVKITLDNGLRVLLRQDTTFPLVSIRVAVDGGVRQEEEELSGISNLMASLWTKGTRRYSANQIARISESLGMDLSGYAGRNSYGLTATLLSEDIVKGLDLIEDVIKNPAFSQEELDKDREFMKSVIRARDDNIFRYSDQKLRELLFETHPFRLSTQGTEETLDLILRDDIVELYDRLTAPNHMVISIFGDIDPTEMAKDLKKRFSTLTRKDVTLSEYMEEPPVTTREKNITLKKEQAMVMYGFMAPEIDDEDYYGIEILTAILGSSFSGRMFANIREQLGQAYTLGGQYVPGLDSGYMFFYILTTADSVPKVKELMDKEFRDLQLQPVSEKELTGIKTYLKGTYEASHQTNHALSFTSVLDELYGLGYNRYQNYQAGIDQVTARDIVRLANEYLDLQKGALLTVTPESLHSKQTMLK